MIKINLQLLAEPAAGDPGGSPEPTPAATPTPPASVTFSPEQLTEIDRIATERTERASNAALKSYFQQQGLSQEQAAEAIKSYKDTQSSKLSPEAQAQIEAADKRAAEALTQASNFLIQAEARVQAAGLGIRPDRFDTVMEMAKLSDVKVKDGKVDAEAAKKALEKVLEKFPEWKVDAQQPGFRVGGDGNNKPGVDDDLMRRAFGLSPKK